MYNVYGRLCPYCKAKLNPYDNIVFCSECNMPHHFECWLENKQCTTFGCQGTIDSPKDISSDAIEFDIEDFALPK